MPAIAIPVLAYGLTACWLVPSYFKVTAENMIYVSEHGTTWSIWLALGVTVIFALVTDWLARGKPERAWGVFLAGCVVFFSLNVLGNFYFNFRIAGEPIRLLPELDMIYIMAIVLLLQWMWSRPGIALRGVAIAWPRPSIRHPATFATPGTCSPPGRITKAAWNIASRTGCGRTCLMRAWRPPARYASGSMPGTIWRNSAAARSRGC